MPVFLTWLRIKLSLFCYTDISQRYDSHLYFFAAETLWSEVIRKPLLFRHIVLDNAPSRRINSYLPVHCIVFLLVFLLSHFAWWLLICNLFIPSPASSPTCCNILCSLSAIKGSPVCDKVRYQQFLFGNKRLLSYSYVTLQQDVS
jgi:hypothetical protein